MTAAIIAPLTAEGHRPARRGPHGGIIHVNPHEIPSRGRALDIRAQRERAVSGGKAGTRADHDVLGRIDAQAGATREAAGSIEGDRSWRLIQGHLEVRGIDIRCTIIERDANPRGIVNNIDRVDQADPRRGEREHVPAGAIHREPGRVIENITRIRPDAANQRERIGGTGRGHVHRLVGGVHVDVERGRGHRQVERGEQL